MIFTPKLKYIRTNSCVPSPCFSTQGAACFDVAASFHGISHVSGYDEKSNEEFVPVKYESFVQDFVVLRPGCRIMIPTGLILDIPEGYSVRVHGRSSLAKKFGVTLSNCEGVIDYDFIDPIYILLHNHSRKEFKIHNGDRVAQLEMVPMLRYKLEESDIPPVPKTDRAGGWGSTGR